MTALLVVVAVAAIAFIAYAVVRRVRRPASAADVEGFSRLSEAERCDYLFALSALDDPANRDILRGALEDPSEIVALAAARSLVAAGGRDELDAFLTERDDERSRHITSTLELLT
jgi:HEAT repeat protein